MSTPSSAPDEPASAPAPTGGDRIERAIKHDLHLRVLAAVTSDLVREACERHELTGAAAIVLGRLLTAGCLMATLTKNADERLRVEVRGSGALGSGLLDCRGDGRVRGFLPRRPRRAELPPAPLRAERGRVSVGSYVGRVGTLVVTRDVGLEQPYQGTVALTSGEVDEDLEAYLTRSEQMPSALGCEVIVDNAGRVRRAGGVLCQTFPEGDPRDVERLRGSLRRGTLYELLEARARTTAELIGFALGGDAYDSMGSSQPRFHCHCGRDTARSIVSTLGADDLEALAAERDMTEIRCSFCGSAYALRSDELRALAAELRHRRS